MHFSIFYLLILVAWLWLIIKNTNNNNSKILLIHRPVLASVVISLPANKAGQGSFCSPYSKWHSLQSYKEAVFPQNGRDLTNGEDSSASKHALALPGTVGTDQTRANKHISS